MAGRIPQPFIDELVARIDIVEVIGARLQLKKSGREFKAPCPFHNEKTPSFWVSPDKQFYHCFGCGAHGTVVGFLMQYEKLGFVEAVEDLAQRVGMELPKEARQERDGGGADLHELMANAARFYEQNLQDDPRAGRYIAERGVEPASGAKFMLGYAPDSWSSLLNRFGAHEEDRRRLLQCGLIAEREVRNNEARGYYDRFRDRLMFPIRDSRGRVIAFGGRIIDQGEPKYLNSPETALFHKGRELYGLYEARQAHADFKRLMVVEGYMDVVRLHQAGITYAVATLGTATTQEHLNKIFRLTSEVVFCFDGDRAGRQAAWRALENALPLARDGRELKFLFLPDGQDPDSLVAQEGAAGIESRLKNALPLSEYLVRQLLVQVDMTHLDGRARLAALARPLFSRLPEGVYRELLADRIAAEIRMPAEKLRALLLGGTTSAAPPPDSRRPAHEAMSAGRGNMLRQAISLVLHYPRAAKSVLNAHLLANSDRPGIGVLRRLLEQAQEAREPNTATLLERWRDLPEYERLAELAALQPLAIDADAAARELTMAVEKLVKSLGPGRRMDELLLKAGEIGLNYDEKAELSLLLKSKDKPALDS
jgi:DNA primase